MNLTCNLKLFLLKKEKMSYCAWVKEEIHRDNFSPGQYNCSQCDYPLFSSSSKYEHDTPWPAFTQPIHPDSLLKEAENEPQMSSKNLALKVSCGKCKNSLGHEFVGDGPGGKSRF
ncbi:methionine-R-sulfoxide reductase B1 [Eurytemora carolleeae]|uniref:methionine-R-sulfoxide reductase B1 n=1 Tax=Eurytemora carolleeae TaxID=1294199 RepID=UPI000C75C518|nr:methionine-R-sulfoxide reductase B1 [Eurytemora carolleeae]|eukprot:XP_023346113.1 methionine-R-sulfoxide reductase B1-like [Eurytemora affinis]